MKFITFDNKTIDETEMEHQHLSNRYWFDKIFWHQENTDCIRVAKERFNGQLLPYRPCVRFKQELIDLYKKGMLKAASATHFIIHYQDNEIGEIRFFNQEEVNSIFEGTIKIIYHGGCLSCISQEKYGIERCNGCQYRRANWSLPNLQIEECTPR